MPTLTEKIAELEAFERTPGGGALVKYRNAITVAVMTDETGCDGKRNRCWAAVREAESALMAEIKRMQDRA